MLSFPFLNSAAHFLTVLYEGDSLPCFSMKSSWIFLGDIPFLLRYHMTALTSTFSILSVWHYLLFTANSHCNQSFKILFSLPKTFSMIKLSTDWDFISIYRVYWAENFFDHTSYTVFGPELQPIQVIKSFRRCKNYGMFPVKHS